MQPQTNLIYFNGSALSLLTIYAPPSLITHAFGAYGIYYMGLIGKKGQIIHNFGPLATFTHIHKNMAPIFPKAATICAIGPSQNWQALQMALAKIGNPNSFAHKFPHANFNIF